VSEAFFHVAADALNWCRISRANPLPLAGLREPFLTERSFRSRQNTKLAVRDAGPQRSSMMGPNPTCSRRSPDGRPTTSGSSSQIAEIQR
jgi:hypothetical protein